MAWASSGWPWAGSRLAAQLALVAHSPGLGHWQHYFWFPSFWKLENQWKPRNYFAFLLMY